MDKKKLLIISHVPPYPVSAGQNARVRYSLLAAKNYFEVHFLTFSSKEFQKNEVIEETKKLVDNLIIIPSKYYQSKFHTLFYKFRSKQFVNKTGLKESNFIIGEIEFTEKRLKEYIISNKYDIVLFEYFHAYKLAESLKNSGITTLLDTHNILWKTYIQQLSMEENSKLDEEKIGKYKKIEEKSWNSFNYLISINSNEDSYIKEKVGSEKVLYIPMGVDLSKWDYVFDSKNPEINLGFYGGMGSPRNKKYAMECVDIVMPEVWKTHPEAKFYIIGSNPSEELIELGKKDHRIVVTGFVDNVSTFLKNVKLILCPWEGKYGFRSRMIEVLASGIPVVASYDALDGMDYKEGEGVCFVNNIDEMVIKTNDLINNLEEMNRLSHIAREHTMETYTYENTYLSGFKKIREII
jgi:glycosyltransferase involved in cell wall biosynthesis